MEEIEKFIETLPLELSSTETYNLFNKYQKTKDYFLKEKIINHNLRKCADFAKNFCKKYRIGWKFEEVYSDCVYALVKAVEDNNGSLGNFRYLFLLYMQTEAFSNHLKYSQDLLSQVEDGDGVKDVASSLEIDETESNFIDELTGDLLVEDVIKFIDSWDNERSKLSIKYYFGIDGCEQRDQKEIAKILNCSQGYISNLIHLGIRKVKEFIATQYSLSYPDIVDEINNTLKFKNIEERNAYIINCYFGIDGEQLSRQQIADNLGVSIDLVGQVIHKVDKDLGNHKRSKMWNDEFKKSIFDAYFGLNGNKIHTSSEIIDLFELKITKHYFASRIYSIRQEMVRKGIVTPEELENLEIKRKEFLYKQRMDKFSYLYNSFHGINGCEKKSQLDLSKETGMYYQSIGDYIREYEEYLNSQSEMGEN